MNLLSKKIETAITHRLNRGESIRIDHRTLVDTQCVTEVMCEIDPDAYITAQRLIATGSSDQAQSGADTLRDLWDSAVAVILQENAKAIHEQTERLFGGAV